MLVLSRKSGESIIIAGNIIVTILAIEGHQVRIGITAPPEVTVMRQEVCDDGGIHHRGTEEHRGAQRRDKAGATAD